MNFLSRLFGKKTVLTLQMLLMEEGVLIRLYRNGALLELHELLSPNLAKNLPEPLTTHLRSQQSNANIIQLPVAKALLQKLQPFVSDKFKLDCQLINDLNVVQVPSDFGIHFKLVPKLEILERVINGADRYLGNGWFQKGMNVWSINEKTSKKFLPWLSMQKISGKDFHRFVAIVIPESQSLGLPITCELSLQKDFWLHLHLQNVAKRSLTVVASSSHPNLLNNLSYIAGEDLHMLSGTFVLPNLRPLVTSQILEIARSSTGMRITGLDIPKFIQDDLRPNAALLKVEMQEIDNVFTVIDSEETQKRWQLMHEIVKGIGRYMAIPSLVWKEDIISEQALLKLINSDQRFIQIENGWVEFRTQIKERLLIECKQNFHQFGLTVRELLNIDIGRLKQISLELPAIESPSGENDRDGAVEYFDIKRLHGLPAAITGLQEEISIIFLKVCNRLHLAYPQAPILWIVKSKRLEYVEQAVQRETQLSSALRQEKLIIVSAESITEKIAKKDWTLVIFQELDLFPTSYDCIKLYQDLNRSWTIASFAKLDWNNDHRRLDTVLAAFQLTPRDALVFQTKCVRNFVQQQSSLFSKLVSFFKPVAARDIEKSTDVSTKDVPIPPRVVAQKTTVVPASTTGTQGFSPALQPFPVAQSSRKAISSTTIVTGSFVQQALRYVDYREASTEPVPFMMYWPTYEQMTSAQRKWYFYWRSELRSKHFLPTDLSYLFLYAYEAINLVGFNSAQMAFEHLIDFWQYYRQLQPKLDSYLVDWLADFVVVHNLELTPLQWYAKALSIGYCSGDQALLLEAWSKFGNAYSDLPSGLLYRLGDYSVSNNKFYQIYHTDLSLDTQLKLGVEVIDQYLQKKEGRSLFQPTELQRIRQIRRAPFAGALHDYKEREITITDVHDWFDDGQFTKIIKSILKQSENLLREKVGYKSMLRGIELPVDWVGILKGIFGSTLSEKASEVKPQPVFTIDMSSVELLRRESETVRARLQIAEDNENQDILEPVMPDEPSTISISPEITLVNATVPTYTQRPENTPNGLLTDLAAISAIMGHKDAPSAKILSALRDNEWQATLPTLNQAIPNSFVNVVLDEINECSYRQIGDALVFDESGVWIVADDFRDEISYILDHPSYANGIVSETPSQSITAPSSDIQSELGDELGDFANKMQPYHWQALEVLISGINVPMQLDMIARTIHLTSSRLIDDINEYALGSIGDIVIDVSDGVPRLEQEDIEGLKLLLAWANAHNLYKE